MTFSLLRFSSYDLLTTNRFLDQDIGYVFPRYSPMIPLFNEEIFWLRDFRIIDQLFVHNVPLRARLDCLTKPSDISHLTKSGGPKLQIRPYLPNVMFIVLFNELFNIF